MKQCTAALHPYSAPCCTWAAARSHPLCHLVHLLGHLSCSRCGVRQRTSAVTYPATCAVAPVQFGNR